MDRKNSPINELVKTAGTLDPIRAERLEAVAAVLKGKTIDEVAATSEVAPATVRAWKKLYDLKGVEGLAEKPGGANEKLILAKGSDPSALYQMLRRGTRDAWLWLNNEQSIRITYSTVYNWRKKLLASGSLP